MSRLMTLDEMEEMMKEQGFAYTECECCENSKTYHEPYITHGNRLWIDGQYIPVNYCPMCGRKLGETK